MDQNGLIEVLGDLADDLFSKLFCEENDHEQALALIEKFYQNKTETLPSLDDVMMPHLLIQSRLIQPTEANYRTIVHIFQTCL